MIRTKDRRFTPAAASLEPRLALSGVHAAALPVPIAGLPVIQLGQTLQQQPGDVLAFYSNNHSLFGSQFHFQVNTGTTSTVIGIYASNGVGKARNQVGSLSVDKVLAKGEYIVVVTGEPGPYRIKVTQNSLAKKIFG